MKVSKMRDHSPVKLRNEINIKIDNSGRISKKTKPVDEEKALENLNNMEYNNQAIMMRNGQGYSRGSGGGFIIPKDEDANILKRILATQSNQNNGLINELKNFKTSLGTSVIPSSYQNPNDSTSFNHPTPEQTATVEILDNELTPSEIQAAIEGVPPQQQMMAIEDAKRRKRGRPTGSKNKPKEVQPTIIEPKFESPVQQTDQPFHAIFDNPDNDHAKLNMKERSSKKGDNVYTKHLQDKKLTMNQVPPRPDRNVGLHSEL
jgi:hypothetical protein